MLHFQLSCWLQLLKPLFLMHRPIYEIDPIMICSSPPFIKLTLHYFSYDRLIWLVFTFTSIHRVRWNFKIHWCKWPVNKTKTRTILTKLQFKVQGTTSYTKNTGLHCIYNYSKLNILIQLNSTARPSREAQNSLRILLQYLNTYWSYKPRDIF